MVGYFYNLLATYLEVLQFCLKILSFILGTTYIAIYISLPGEKIAAFGAIILFRFVEISQHKC
jgi:hypothetical protein